MWAPAGRILTGHKNLSKFCIQTPAESLARTAQTFPPPPSLWKAEVSHMFTLTDLG